MLRIRLMVSGCAVVTSLIVAGLVRDRAFAAPAPADKKPTVDEVATAWLPDIKGATVDKYGGLLHNDGQKGVAARTFDVRGASFEDVWNFYAAKCEEEQKYAADKFPQLYMGRHKGRPSTAVQDREIGLDPVTKKRGDHLASFTFRDPTVVLTVTITPGRDGSDRIVGVMTVVLASAFK
ncbi:hypothetical protein [Limnoglobus roseus]|uniref:RNA polymerase sigma factor n=1 Tax=Limnoglobus roseus TaxID=2598579 RepID=A0A5C1AKW9_9BACT|nr:hypothetical protein [Limnoglobus roseus]QEL17528.1 RNA polymerase sigma factor [Limnoglobus roseus]